MDRKTIRVSRSSIFRWDRVLQWFGVAMLLLATGLAMFTDLHHQISGINLIAVLGMLGLPPGAGAFQKLEQSLLGD